MKILLHEVRIRKRISQRQLSFRSGVSRSYISEIESHSINPTAVTLCRLANVLDCTLNDLVDCE